MNIGSLLPSRYRLSHEPLRSERRIELMLVVLALLVLLQLLWWGVGVLREVPMTPVAPARDSLQVVEATGTGSISASQSLQLQSRPLFWGARRPTAPFEINAVDNEETAEGTPAKRLQNFRLTGLYGAGANGGAIVTYKGERTRLGVGDGIDGWTLLSVDADEAVFASAGAKDARRLLPLPVVAVIPQKTREFDTPDALPPTPGANGPATSPPPAQEGQANPQTATRPATLSLGGR